MSCNWFSNSNKAPSPKTFLFSNSVLISLSTVAVITNLNEPEDEAQLVEHDFLSPGKAKYFIPDKQVSMFLRPVSPCFGGHCAT